VGNRNGGEREGRRGPSRRDRGARPVAPGRSHSCQRRHSRSAGDGETARPRRALSQKLGPGQAGIAQAALRVQDPQLRGPTRRPEPVPRHEDLRPLADHVTPQPDPRPPAQLQSQRGDLGEGTGQGGGKARRLQDDQLNACSPGQRSQPAESLCQSGRDSSSIQGPGLQVQQQQVHGSILEEHRRHRQRFLERARRQDDQPVQLDAPSHGLDRIQASGQVQVCRDPSGSLGLGHGLEREGRLAAGPVAVECGGRVARQTTQSEDRVQGAEAGGYRPIRCRRQRTRPARQLLRIQGRTRPRRHRQRAFHLPSPARSCPAPAFPEGRQSGLDVRGRGRHGIQMIEHLFY
jgi:hypothetical protein